MRRRRLWPRIAAGVAGVAGGAAAWHLWSASRLTRSDHHTFASAAYQYLTFKAMAALGRAARTRLDDDCKDYEACQEALLRELLEANKATAFGRDHGFEALLKSDRLMEEFRRRMPLTRYDAYRSYIDQMQSGEDPAALTSDTVDLFAVTSGTSGHRNVLPTTHRQRKVFFLNGIAPVFDCMFSAFPEAVQLQRTCKVTYMPTYSTCEAGLRIGPNSSSPGDKSFQRLLPLYSTPKEAYALKGNEAAALYIHALFALKDRQLGIIEANFSSVVYTLFAQIERSPVQLIRDVETGRLSPSLAIPDAARRAIEARMKPDPKRAEELRRAMFLGQGERVQVDTQGLARRIWPNLNLLLTVNTGAFSLYGERLESSFTRGVPIYSPIYAATEGLVGVNVHEDKKNENVAYTLVPKAMVFEFLPLCKSDEDPKHMSTKLAHELTIGEKYELVVTNLSGMCRYRFGDVVKFVGHHYHAPKVEFCYRTGQLLNVRGEKTSETMMLDALRRTFGTSNSSAQEPNRTQLREYACAEYIHGGHVGNRSQIDDVRSGATDPPHYVIFVETDSNSKLDLPEAAEALDLELRRSNPVYASYRIKNAIDPLKLVQVKPGSFGSFKDKLVEAGTAANQLKIPRVLKRKNDVDFLWRSAV